jgi:hypothetical protein
LFTRPLYSSGLVRSVDVGGRRDFGVVEQRQDRDEHGFDALHRGPPLRGGLAGHFVVAGGVKDRDAEAAVGVDVGVVEGADELEVWRGNY